MKVQMGPLASSASGTVGGVRFVAGSGGQRVQARSLSRRRAGPALDAQRRRFIKGRRFLQGANNIDVLERSWVVAGANRGTGAIQAWMANWMAHAVSPLGDSDWLPFYRGTFVASLNGVMTATDDGDGTVTLFYPSSGDTVEEGFVSNGFGVCVVEDQSLTSFEDVAGRSFNTLGVGQTTGLIDFRSGTQYFFYYTQGARPLSLPSDRNFAYGGPVGLVSLTIS